MSYFLSLHQNQLQKQSLKQSQKLMMSPQMQQAIHLLQMPVMELSRMIDQELEQNPVLELVGEEEIEEDHLEQELEIEEIPLDGSQPVEKELMINENRFEILKRLDEEFRDHFAESGSYFANKEEKTKNSLENSLSIEESLIEHLTKQVFETFEDALDLKIAEEIIGNLDERGFLGVGLDEIAAINNVGLERVLIVLDEVQTFDPKGIAARNLQESLLIQLRASGKKRSLAYEIIKGHFDDLKHNRLPLIQKNLKKTLQEIKEAIDTDIVKLDLHPGNWHDRQRIHFIVPDVKIKEENRELVVEVNDDSIPSLRLNRRYMQILEDDSFPVETKEYIRHKILSGKWLMRNIRQRNETLERIAKSLLKRHKEFFTSLEGKLVPLTMKAVAEELELHESTIARAVAGKYLDCSRGIFLLRSFFTNAYLTNEGTGMSSATVKDVLLDIIAKEDKKNPLSDEAISKAMKEKGIPCARRTIAKYRLISNIGNASQRKNYE